MEDRRRAAVMVIQIFISPLYITKELETNCTEEEVEPADNRNRSRV
jgi:hypothetical protein